MSILPRVAIVTGASKGIGRAIALRLAKDGHDIAINDLPSARQGLDNLKSEISKSGRRAIVCEGNVSVEKDVQNLVNSTAEQLGSVDVMVANAGIFQSSRLVDTSVDDWDRVLSVNTRGVFLCYKHAAAQMLKQGRGGRIIGASSVAGKQGQAALSAYCASKFAVRGLTQVAALELGRSGITVNAYGPGAVQTDLLEQSLEGQPPEAREYLTAMQAVDFLGEPDDIAGLVSYLASPESRFVTGQVLSINGGMHLD